MTLWGRPAGRDPTDPIDHARGLPGGTRPGTTAVRRGDAPRYVRDDLKAIQETAPDVVIGDFRLSLAVSARVARVPYLAITNAYWSPYARQRFPIARVASDPVVRPPGGEGALPPGSTSGVRPPRPALNRVRKEYGLPGLGPDLRRIYTEADRTLYADVPELVPTFDRPAHHHYLGPILWSFPWRRPPGGTNSPRTVPGLCDPG